MRYALGLVLLAFLGAVAVFALQNTQTVAVRFLNGTLAAPFAVLAVGIYLLGMLTGGTVVGFLRRSLRQVTTEPRPRTR